VRRAGRPVSATTGGLDELDQSSRRLPVTVEMLSGAGHPIGEFRCALLAAPLNPE